LNLRLIAKGEGALKKFCYVGVLFLVLVLLNFPAMFSFSAAGESSAVLWSDKKDYFPDETARIFGYGFAPFSQVNVTVVRPDLNSDIIVANTDEFGYFECHYQLDGIHGTFNVTATDGVNTATTSFQNCLFLIVKWCSHCCWYIKVRAVALKPWKSYYVKYFDPNGVERRQSPTYSGVVWFKDNFTIVPSLPDILGWWTVKLYENDVVRRIKCVYVGKMVWTTDSTYNNLVTSFNQGETIYFKAIGLNPNMYYKFMFKTPSGNKIYVGDWTTGVETLTGSYTLPPDAETGSWKLHVREASDASGTCEHHYVDTCYFEVTVAPPPPPRYYLTVKTDPEGIVTIPGEGWYNASTYVNLTAPDLVAGPANNIRYRFDYWDVDGVSQGTGITDITVFMDANHTATAHYVVQYYLNMTANPPDVTVPSGEGWYDANTTVSIFAPEFVSVVAGASRYRFDSWTTADMSEIADPYSYSTTVYLDKPKTVTANYVKQYKITFEQTGVDSDYTGTILTVDGNDYDYSSLPVSFWWDEGSTHTFAYYSPLVVTPNLKRYVWTSTTGLSNQQSDTITVTTNGTITGNYKTQYYLNLETSPSGITTPVGEGWYDAGATASISTEEIIEFSSDGRYKFVKWTTGDMSEISDPYSASTTVLMDKAKTVTANYETQYKLTVRTNGLETYVTNVYNGTDVLGTATDATPYTGWFDEGAIIYLNIDSPITDSSERKVFTEWSGDATGTDRPLTLTMDSAKDITANYKTQYFIVFTQSGLDDTATGTVVTINSADYEFTDLPYSIWADEGSTFTYSYQDIVLSSTAGKRFKLVGVSGPTSPFTVTGPITVTGNYKIQYQVTFDQTGLDPSATGTVVTVNGTPLDYGSLPFSQWLDEGTTVTYSYESIVSSTTQGKRFSLSDITGPASPFIVDGPKTIIGNYLTQYYLTVTSPFGTPSGEGWYDAGATAYAGLDTGLIDHGNGTRRIFVNWSGDASGTNYAQSDPITMNAPKEAIANWQTQYYLTVQVDPSGITTIPGEGWYNKSETVMLTAPDVAGYQFDYWDIDGTSQGTGVSTITVQMNAPHTATAHYKEITKYTLTITATTGGTTSPTPGTYTYDEGTIVSVTAIPEEGYFLDHWELDGSYYGTDLTVEVTMNADHELKAIFSPTVKVSITPPSATINVGDSVTFTASPSGGKPPYSYQWYLNGNPIPGANSSTWTFTGTKSGIYYIYVVVTDSARNEAQSSTAKVTVRTPIVGGPVFPISTSDSELPSSSYDVFLTFPLVFLAMTFYLIIRRRKRRN